MSFRAKWKKKLRLAQFRGVKFHIDDSKFSTGRRGPDHEYPDKDIPFAEDTGRKQHHFQIDAYVLGSDYLADKDRLIAACEKPGPGELIHPYFGRKMVVCRTCDVSESSSEGGIAKFSLTFVEAGKAEFPRGRVDKKGMLDEAAGALNKSAIDEFKEKFSVLNQPQFVLDDATDKIEGVTDTIDGHTKGAGQGIAELAFSLRKFKASIRDVLGTPGALAERMDNQMTLLKKSLTADDLLDATRDLFGTGKKDKPIPRNTATREQQAQNNDAINELTKTLAVSRAAQAASEKTYASVDDGQTQLSELNDQIDELMGETSSDDVFAQLQNLRAQAASVIPPEDENLARVTSYTPNESAPSLVLAYDLYESQSLESDLIARNKVSNPAFVPGGKSLEILDRG